jgi:UDP-N-acetyl-D-glucosamine dehydrogenase
MPSYVVARVREALNSARKPLNGSAVLVIGLAYKANVDDDRQSPSYRIMELLRQNGAVVSYYDPHVPMIPQTRDYPHFAGTKSELWNAETIAGFDVVVIATAHNAINFQELADWAQRIVDTRNVMSTITISSERVWKA